MLPVVQQLVALCRDGLGEWCHWGATTQDITDTATILQIREALDLVEADIVAIADALAALAKKYRDTPMAGRSNLQQAVPITFGYKMATLLAAFERHTPAAATSCAPRVLVGEFGGAAGTLSSLGGRGLEVQAALMKELGLGQPEIAWHTVRDRIAEVGCFLGLVTGMLRQDRLRREADDADRGRGGLRAVPRGPRLVEHDAAEAQPDLLGLHHRDHLAGAPARRRAARRHGRGPRARDRPVGDRVDRGAGNLQPRRRCAGADPLRRVGAASSTRRRCASNLDLTRGLIVSEAVMMGLGPHLGRQYAHDLVYDICRQVVATGRPLLDLLAENKEITKHLDRAALAKLCDPANYLGEAGDMVDRVLALRGK